MGEMRSFDPDYYKLLEVGSDASAEEIRSAFRRMAKRFHPDKDRGHEEEFNKVRTAYETLIEKNLRAEYDKYLQLLAGNDSLLEVRETVQDVYDDMIGFLRSITGFGNRQEYEIVLKRKYKERDKIVKVLLPVEDVCKKCLGTGGTIFGDCPMCNGKGKVGYKKDFDIFIPKGF